MFNWTTEAWSSRLLALGVALSVAACAAVPGTTGGKTPSKGTKGTSPSVASSKAPSPTPSLGLLLQGKVTVDAKSMLSNGLVQKTTNGVKLISDNGLGLISDNGLGLISDNGLGLISDNGLGLISDNGLGLISDNGLGLVSNNSAGFRIQAVPDAAPTGLQPVEGMVVTAVNLFTGKVIAGPVPTKADGSYQLGFLKTPGTNIGIVASVNVKSPVAKYTYASLIAPVAKPVVTSDTTRALTRYMLGVLPARMQPWVEGVKNGMPDPVDENDTIYEKQLKQLLAKIPPEKMKEADKMPDGRNGQIALDVSRRLLSFLDLSGSVFQDFYAVTEEARQFGDTIQPQPEPNLVDQVIDMARRKQADVELPGLLIKYGMPADKANDLSQRMDKGGEAVGTQIVLMMIAHQKEIFAPLEELAKP